MDYEKEGRAAFARGLKAREVPYPDWERRSLWGRGWYDAEQETA